MRNIITSSVPEENSRLQWRCFREFRNSVTDIENNSQWTDFLTVNITHKKKNTVLN